MANGRFRHLRSTLQPSTVSVAPVKIKRGPTLNLSNGDFVEIVRPTAHIRCTDKLRIGAGLTKSAITTSCITKRHDHAPQEIRPLGVHPGICFVTHCGRRRVAQFEAARQPSGGPSVTAV